MDDILKQILSELKEIRSEQAAMRSDIEQIKEDTSITRTTVNELGDWAEIAASALKIEYPVKK